MFRTLIARYPGTCRRCGQAITPGQSIRWKTGKGNTWHLASECPGHQETPATRPALDPGPNPYAADEQAIANPDFRPEMPPPGHIARIDMNTFDDQMDF